MIKSKKTKSEAHRHEGKPWCYCGLVWCEVCQRYFMQKPGEGDHLAHPFDDDDLDGD